MEEKAKKKVKFTRNQWLTYIVIGLTNTFYSTCISLQAPFYPIEAAKRGATPSEFGFVFGVYELVGFIVAPLVGQYMHEIGTNRVYYGGIYVGAIGVISFGALDLIQDRTMFILFSFVFRIIEAIGNNAVVTASFAIIAKMFPDNVATTFSTMEVAWGVGFFIGPWIGGRLYEVGGFYLPFVIVGVGQLIVALAATMVLPKSLSESIEKQECEKKSNVWKILKIPEVFVSSVGLTSMSMAGGYIVATLEPHLRQFNFTPTQIGYFFVLQGILYAVGAPVVGYMLDRFINPKPCALFGSILGAVAFCFIGPIPFMPYDTQIWSIILGLVLNSIAFACVYVACFTDALRTCLRRGLPDNIQTYGLISGLFISNYALGSFIGPSIGGVLFDLVGFCNGSYFVFAAQTIVAIMFITLMIKIRRRSRVTPHDVIE